MNQNQLIQCIGCGSENAFVAFNGKYHGLRGNCPDCGSNWPES